MIAFFESTLNATAHQRLKLYFSDDVLEDEDDPDLQDPETDHAEHGVIAKEKFADLVKVFPKYVYPAPNSWPDEHYSFNLVIELLHQHLCIVLFRIIAATRQVTETSR